MCYVKYLVIIDDFVVKLALVLNQNYNFKFSDSLEVLTEFLEKISLPKTSIQNSLWLY